jgi:hypothetical protein
MGTRASIKYKQLEDSEEFIELENFKIIPGTVRSTSELSYNCQKLIILGFPLEAFFLLKESRFDPSELSLQFHMQEFIELVLRKKSIEAMRFAQKAFATRRDECVFVLIAQKKLKVSVGDVMGLLCYENPEDSPLSYLLDPGFRSALSLAVEILVNPPRKSFNICRRLCCCRRKQPQKVNLS